MTFMLKTEPNRTANTRRENTILGWILFCADKNGKTDTLGLILTLATNSFLKKIINW